MRNNITVMLVGAGDISIDYDKVLKKLGISFFTVTRGTEKAKLYEEKNGTKPITGGLQKYFSNNEYEIPTHAILAVGIEELFENCMLLIEKGVQHILIEKPGGKSFDEIKHIAEAADMKGSNVFIAYNRRFYASVIKAREIIENDKGVEAFHFEFTEWGHKIELLKKNDVVKQVWFLANSTHVADMAFFLGGKPEKMSSFVSGGNSWHPASNIFAGAGISENRALFTYHAHWNAPGRWGVEIITHNYRLIFRPLEKLSMQRIGSIETEEISFNDSKDIEFKPGLYMQVKSWLEKDYTNLCTIQEQLSMMKWYYQIANY